VKRSPLLIIFLTVFLDLVGFGIILPLLPRFAAEHHATEWQIGLLMATYSLMQFVFAPIWGRLSDRIGRRPILLFSISGSAASYLLFALAPSLPLLFLSRAIAGIMAANIGTAQACIADITPPGERARGMGMIGAAFGLGFILGPAIAGILGHWAVAAGHSPQLVVGLAAAAFSFFDLLLAARLLPETRPAEVRRTAVPAPPVGRFARMQTALRHPGLGLPILVFFLTTVAWSQLEPTVALVGQRRFNFGPGELGWLFAYVGLIVAIVQGGFAGRMARKSGEPRMVLTGALLMAAALGLMPGVGSVGGLYAVLGLLGLGQAMTLPALYSLISRATAGDGQGTTLGVTQSFSSLARAIGPAVGGVLFGMREAYPFWLGAVLMLGAFAIALPMASRLRKGANQQSAVPGQ
jgi:MFS transporter, DHA1 family, tetracycline resistance protein